MKFSKTDFKFPEGKKILVYGYGNPGRQDDGQGYQFVSHIEKNPIPGVDIDFNYQLNIEDASNIDGFDIVVFVDASLRIEDDFTFAPISPKEETAHTTHAISPEAVLHLHQYVHKKIPEAYLLEIKGYEWELEEKLTSKGEVALLKAINYFYSCF